MESAATKSASRLVPADVAAEHLSVPISWVMNRARAGKLPHHKLGHYTRFKLEELDAWIASESQEGKAA